MTFARRLAALRDRRGYMTLLILPVLVAYVLSVPPHPWHRPLVPPLSPLASLYEHHDWFQLRDSITPTAPLLYRAAVAYVFHDFRSAEALAKEASAKGSSNWDRREAHCILFSLYMDELRYSEAAQELELVKTKFHYAIDPSSRRVLPILSRFPKQQVAHRGYASVSRIPTGWSGYNLIPLTVNGKSAAYLLDTGASHNVVSEDEAARLGLRVLNVPGFEVTDALGNSGRAHIALAEDLSVGEVRLQNAVFVVQSSGLFQGQPVDHQGILGKSVLQAFETIRWNRNGAVEIGFPSEPLRLAEANVSFDLQTPLIVAVQFRSRTINAEFDSGASMTMFLKRFSQDFPDVARTSIGLWGENVGASSGSRNVTLKILPHVQFAIGGHSYIRL